jgi:hypothetical protein
MGCDASPAVAQVIAIGHLPEAIQQDLPLRLVEKHCSGDPLCQPTLQAAELIGFGCIEAHLFSRRLASDPQRRSCRGRWRPRPIMSIHGGPRAMFPPLPSRPTARPRPATCGQNSSALIPKMSLEADRGRSSRNQVAEVFQRSIAEQHTTNNECGAPP